MMTRTVEYEVAKLLRDEKDMVVGREVLLPEEGKPFPRVQQHEGLVREEIVRKHNDILSFIPSRDIEVNVRPFVQS